MRLLLKLSAVDGLVNERQCTVVKVVPHEDEPDIPPNYHQVKLKYMLRGIWVRFDDFDAAPMAEYLCKSKSLSSDGTDSDQACAAIKALAGSLVFVQLQKADFKLRVHLPDDSYDSVSVVRWQFPLTHAMVRTAMSSPETRSR